MQFKNFSKEEIKKGFRVIDNYLSEKEVKFVKYVDFGCKIVRLIGYSEEFLPHIEKQLTFGLREEAEKYDATLILWQEEDLLALSKLFSTKNQKIAVKTRFEITYKKANKVPVSDTIYDIQIMDDEFSKVKPIIDFQTTRGFFVGNNKEENIYYYGVKNLEPEEFIKEGHLFVQFFNNILKTETSNLVHGAVIGYNGNGICFCARGQRGKSTLSVLSMMKGFEYVSDDYLILHQNDKKELLSSPIYSIITLSPEMYNRLYGYMQSSQFVSNNARKDKYVFNISNFHDRFKMNYPIKLCIFPEIVTDKDPSIKPCSEEEKGRAIVQLIQSTLMQTQDLSENWTVEKMMNMVKDFPFYKLNLCHDIDRNTEFLRDFMNKFESLENEVIKTPKIAVDITFDLANILNTQIGIIYSMNKFATNIYENLLKGVSKNKLKLELEKYLTYNKDIQKEFEVLLAKLEEKEIYSQTSCDESLVVEINQEFAEECQYRLSFVEYAQERYIELINTNEGE